MKFHLSQVFTPLAVCSACSHVADLTDGKLTCGFDKSTIDVFRPGSCPAGKWRNALETSPSMNMSPVKLPPAEVQKQSIWMRARQFWNVVTSGRAPDDVVARRMLSCRGDDTPANPPCKYLKVEAGKAYCNGCGCGQWPMAELSVKLTNDYLPCPHPEGPRPGFSALK